MLKKTLSGFCAGLLICIGGSVFLSCENRVVGSVLFAVALLCICFKGYSLFTGKVGYIPEDHSKEAVSTLLLGLLGNAVCCILGGWLLMYAVPSIGTNALAVCESKLLQQPLQTFIRGCFCGILMYLAVSIFREKNSVLGIVFCIPVFILSGFEHSIADMFYFAASGMFSLQAFLFIWIVILGNSLGAMILPFINKIMEKSK